MNSHGTISVLNDLIEACFDSQRGFQEAADNATEPAMRKFFSETARDRGRFMMSLMREVRTVGGEIEGRGSVAASLHRLWVTIIGTLSGRNDRQLLAEADRGEASVVKSYEEALLQGLPAYIHTLIEAQYASIRRTQELIKNMLAAAKAASARASARQL
jgi:uncharacterized protein (TIGR02284 family)